MNKKKITKIALIVFFIAYFLCINAVTIFRFWQFEVYYFDHGIFDQSLWNVAHFRPPLIDHLESNFTNQLADHFVPTMYLLSPLYWFTSSYIAIIILDNIFVVGSAIVLFLTGKKLLKSDFMAFTITLAYALFIGLQNAVIANFHTEIPALLTLSLTLNMLLRKKWKWFFVFLLLTLGLKESFVSIGTMLGVYLLLIKEWRVGITTIITSILYYVIAVKIIMENILGTPYGYQLNYVDLYSTVLLFFSPAIKIDTLFISFTSFGFLPLFDPFFLLVILQDYFGRFVLVNTPARIDLGLHYNAMVSVLLAFGAILGLKNIKNHLHLENKFLYVYCLIIIISILVIHHKRHGPLGLSYNKVFYSQTKDVDFLRTFISKIPNTGLVMTQNNIAPQLTHSHNIVLLRDSYWEWMPDVIAIDVRPGQNPNNYWPMPPSSFERFYGNIKKDPNYKLNGLTDTQLIYVKQKRIDKNWYKKLINEN